MNTMLMSDEEILSTVGDADMDSERALGGRWVRAHYERLIDQGKLILREDMIRLLMEIRSGALTYKNGEMAGVAGIMDNLIKRLSQSSLRTPRALDSSLPEPALIKSDPRVYEVWSEGYAATGERGSATYEGSVFADNFIEACEKVAGDKLDRGTDGKLHMYNGRPQIWACEMFDNEADARKAFG